MIKKLLMLIFLVSLVSPSISLIDSSAQRLENRELLISPTNVPAMPQSYVAAPGPAILERPFTARNFMAAKSGNALAIAFPDSGRFCLAAIYDRQTQQEDGAQITLIGNKLDVSQAEKGFLKATVRLMIPENSVAASRDNAEVNLFMEILKEGQVQYPYSGFELKDLIYIDGRASRSVGVRREVTYKEEQPIQLIKLPLTSDSREGSHTYSIQTITLDEFPAGIYYARARIAADANAYLYAGAGIFDAEIRRIDLEFVETN